MITLDRVQSIVESHRANVAASTSKRHVFKPEDYAKGPDAARIAKRAKALAAYADIIGVMKGLRAEGLTFAAIASALNAEGHTTRRGSPWDAANVFRIIDRYGECYA